MTTKSTARTKVANDRLLKSSITPRTMFTQISIEHNAKMANQAVSSTSMKPSVANSNAEERADKKIKALVVGTIDFVLTPYLERAALYTGSPPFPVNHDTIPPSTDADRTFKIVLASQSTWSTVSSCSFSSSSLL